MKKRGLILAFIIFLGTFLRYYHLDALPGEIFGDMVENINHINSVLTFDWKLLYGFDGREALLFYLVAPFAFFLGNTYLTLKSVTALVGVATIVTVFLMARELKDTETGLMAAFLIAVSKWPLIFSRIGFRTVFMPFFVSLILYFIIRAYKHGKKSDFLMIGLLMGFGLYTYTAFKVFIVAVALILLIVAIYARKFFHRNIKHISLSIGIFLIMLLPLIVDINMRPEEYLSHPGPMIVRKDGTIRPDWPTVLMNNIKNQALMYHVKGDIVFRVNPKWDPQLDPISGIFLIIGFAYWLAKHRKLYLTFTLVPFLLLNLPSILVLNFPIDIPSATRSTGLIPFIFFWTALGIVFIMRMIPYKRIKVVMIGTICTSILMINSYKYFIVYAEGLPNHGSAIGRLVAQEIDKAPTDSYVVIVGCCWGAWGQPDHMSMAYALKKRRYITFIDPKVDLVCNELKYNNNVFMILPSRFPKMSCIDEEKVVQHVNTYNEILYHSYAKQ